MEEQQKLDEKVTEDIDSEAAEELQVDELDAMFVDGGTCGAMC